MVSFPQLACKTPHSLAAGSHVPAKLLQSCPTPCNPMDCSPPGSPVHGILQARTLGWVAVPSAETAVNSRLRRSHASFVTFPHPDLCYCELN